MVARALNTPVEGRQPDKSTLGLAQSSVPQRRGKPNRKQIEAIKYAVRLFVQDDLERGVSDESRIFCVACSKQRPRAGAIPYGKYLLCNACAIEFEVRNAAQPGSSVGRFIRDRQFGD